MIKVFGKLGYQIIRQRGSHVRLRNTTEAGDHNITIPRHSELAKGYAQAIIQSNPDPVELLALSKESPKDYQVLQALNYFFRYMF